MTGAGKLVLRATIGGYFFGHGMQKLAGWFGGGGPDGTGEQFEQIGLRPGRENALLAGAAGAARGSPPPPRRFSPPGANKLTRRVAQPKPLAPPPNGPWG